MADLDPEGRARFNERERAVWDAAYAAAFVADFHKSIALSGFDAALRVTTAERPAHVADAAVRELRRWRLQEDHRVGDGFWTAEPPWQPRGQRG